MHKNSSCAEPGFQRRPRDSRVPLTATQRWYLRYLSESPGQGRMGSRLTHLGMRLQGPLDRAALRAALELLVQRHESLRTRIIADDTGAWQIVDEPERYELEIMDVPGSSLDRACQEFVCEKVDLAAGPLFAARLLRVSTTQHTLLFGVDHAITDLASNMVLFKELCVCYEKLVNGAAPALSPMAIQYPDYACWQQLAYEAWLEKHGRFWRDRLGNAPRTRLPASAECLQTIALDEPCAVFTVPFGERLTRELRDLARRCKSPLSVAVLAVYAAALAQWCAEREVLVKFVSNARYRAELLGMVGFLANTLYLRLEVHEGEQFATLLDRTKSELRQAYEHQDLDRIADIMPECDSDFVFNWAPAPTASSRVSIGELNLEPFMMDLHWTRRYFAMFCDTSTDIVAKVWCHRSLAPVVGQFARWLLRAAEQATAHPPVRVGQ